LSELFPRHLRKCHDRLGLEVVALGLEVFVRKAFPDVKRDDERDLSPLHHDIIRLLARFDPPHGLTFGAIPRAGAFAARDRQKAIVGACAREPCKVCRPGGVSAEGHLDMGEKVRIRLMS
jgi:hypothetical protein